MIAVDIALMVVVVIGVVAGVTAMSANKAKRNAELALRAVPDAERQFIKAVRLLDKVVTADDVLPSLPSELNRDIKKYLSDYYHDDKDGS